MNGILYLFLAFTLLPMVELAVIIEVAKRLGTINTLALLILSGIVGSTLAKHQGLRAWSRFQEDLAAGRAPEYGVIDGLLILAGGALLIVPGFLTDLLGLVCLIPVTRYWLKLHLRRRLEQRMEQGNIIIRR